MKTLLDNWGEKIDSWLFKIVLGWLFLYSGPIMSAPNIVAFFITILFTTFLVGIACFVFCNRIIINYPFYNRQQVKEGKADYIIPMLKAFKALFLGWIMSTVVIGSFWTTAKPYIENKIIVTIGGYVCIVALYFTLHYFKKQYQYSLYNDVVKQHLS